MRRATYKNGFTLIELLVSMSIFVLVSTIVLFNFPAFLDKTALNNLAHEIAITVRSAQVYGISVREAGAGTGIFTDHGTFFDRDTNTSFILFADVDKNGRYGGSDVLLEQFTIQKGHSVSRLCGFVTTIAPCTDVNELHVTFTRPNPEATIRDENSTAYAYGTITIAAPRGATRQVTVWANGQISVQ